MKGHFINIKENSLLFDNLSTTNTIFHYWDYEILTFIEKNKHSEVNNMGLLGT